MHPLPKLGHLVTVDVFKPHVGEAFLVDAQPEPVRIVLDEVRAGIMTGVDWLPREPFSLSFSTPWDTMLIEGAYPMKTPHGDLVHVHLIPTQTSPGPRRHYHAVFN